MTFIELKRVNRFGEEKVVLLDTSKVIAITEIHTDGQALYDGNGDLVKVEDAPRRFRVALDGTTMEIIIDETNYETLKKALVK